MAEADRREVRAMMINDTMQTDLTRAQRRDIACAATVAIVRSVIAANGGYRDARAIARLVDRWIAAGAEPRASGSVH
jgi:hypothetical protein